MITTSKFNNSVVFSLAIFCGRGQQDGDRGPRAEDKGRGLIVEEHKHPSFTNYLTLSKTRRTVNIINNVFLKTEAATNFVKITGKHLRQSLFL